MSWPQVATPHVGHRLTLADPYALKCVDCAMTLVIHKETSASSRTPGPPPYRRPDLSQAASPETIALRKREALAALEHARQRRTTASPS